MKEYHEYVTKNPHTLLSRFYGLHRVKLPRGKKIHFVIMNNLFPPHRDIHETYDLKVRLPTLFSFFPLLANVFLVHSVNRDQQ